MKIRINVSGGPVMATLDNNDSSIDLVKQLPMKLTLEDYASTEKISVLPEPLSTQGAPAGFTPSAGDIAFYAPWGNLAIFHKGFKYSSGLIKLGRIDSGLEVLARPGALEATITLVDE
ncbi:MULTISPECIES: cyclophilin-like fold protein [unclassified Pseudomonas]|uniref:cyclophilin-like fold protein n=1 Tax=unclassified Pseudomonas TaxID=196821 RepID=UPI001CC11177|nr:MULTISPECIES: cyclophilin-like fold protein [unclassified Pseudomonas]